MSEFRGKKPFKYNSPKFIKICLTQYLTYSRHSICICQMNDNLNMSKCFRLKITTLLIATKSNRKPLATWSQVSSLNGGNQTHTQRNPSLKWTGLSMGEGRASWLISEITFLNMEGENGNFSGLNSFHNSFIKIKVAIHWTVNFLKNFPHWSHSEKQYGVITSLKFLTFSK